MLRRREAQQDIACPSSLASWIAILRPFLPPLMTAPGRTGDRMQTLIIPADAIKPVARAILRHTRAMSRAGPPVAPSTLANPTTRVAPDAGTWSRFATFSSPQRPEGSQA